MEFWERFDISGFIWFFLGERSVCLFCLECYIFMYVLLLEFFEVEKLYVIDFFVIKNFKVVYFMCI